MANEQFGVSELADALHMSRSNLLRKVKKETKLSVSQLINQVRLKKAMDLLRKSSLNVSEVSHQVGFASTSYFIKCFREFYGYPPGEVGKRSDTEPLPAPVQSKKPIIWIAGGLMIALAAAALYFYFRNPASTPAEIEKSIAVLPFKNESNDSTNTYLINGLMESTLSNLQKIKDLRVISRTSSEKYRHVRKSIPEMAKELNVNYFIEGSGQKIGDRIVLNIQLIDAVNDRHLWSNQYRRETKDIFQLQQEVAKNIADEIKAIITPEEQARIDLKPTRDVAVYDLYLKGKDLQAAGGKDLFKAIDYFKKAIELDKEFALAYAEVAISYYYVDAFQANKQFSRELGEYADKAMFYNPKLGECLVAKALDYMGRKEYTLAEPYLERALEYSPNSSAVVGFLTDFYAIYHLNTGKYLQYALKGIQLNIAEQDSVTASYTFLRLSNALIQNGFVDESLVYMDKALAYNPKNPFARYVRAFILFAKSKDTKGTRELLIEEFKKDSSRFDILQDIGKLSYFMRDYEGAYKYYKQFLEIRESRQLDVYRHENLIIGFTLAKVGMKAKSEELVKSYKGFLDTDNSIYRNLGYAVYYNYLGDQQKAIEHMKLFAEEDNVQYWVILFLESDPLLETLKDNPEYKKYFGEAKQRFWKNHDALSDVLKEKGLL